MFKLVTRPIHEMCVVKRPTWRRKGKTEHEGERGRQNMNVKKEDRTVRTTHVILCVSVGVCVSELFLYDLCQSRKCAAFCVRQAHGLELVYIVTPRACRVRLVLCICVSHLFINLTNSNPYLSGGSQFDWGLATGRGTELPQNWTSKPERAKACWG